MTISVSAVLVCDDVRREDNGKLFLIGVYGQDIRVKSFPATIVLSAAIRLHSSDPMDEDVEFRWSMEGVSHGVQKGRLTLADSGVFFFSVPSMPVINAVSGGIIDLQWRLGEQEWSTLYSIPLLSLDDPTLS